MYVWRRNKNVLIDIYINVSREITFCSTGIFKRDSGGIELSIERWQVLIKIVNQIPIGKLRSESSVAERPLPKVNKGSKKTLSHNVSFVNVPFA